MSDSLAIAEIVRLREEIRNLLQKQAINNLEVSAIGTPDEAADIIAKAIDTAHTAYWAACDTQGRAINPVALNVRGNLLDDAYLHAKEIEGVVKNRGVTWPEARRLSDEKLFFRTSA